MSSCDRRPGQVRGTAAGGAGFTLLEVMVALGIMAIVLTGVYRLQAQTLTMSMETRFYTQAPLLARSALTRYEENARREQRPLTSDQGDFGREFPGYSWKIQVDESPSETLGVDISRDLKRIQVQVLSNQGQLVYALRTYRFVRE